MKEWLNCLVDIIDPFPPECKNTTHPIHSDNVILPHPLYPDSLYKVNDDDDGDSNKWKCPSTQQQHLHRVVVVDGCDEDEEVNSRSRRSTHTQRPPQVRGEGRDNVLNKGRSVVVVASVSQSLLRPFLIFATHPHPNRLY